MSLHHDFIQKIQGPFTMENFTKPLAPDPYLWDDEEFPSSIDGKYYISSTCIELAHTAIICEVPFIRIPALLGNEDMFFIQCDEWKDVDAVLNCSIWDTDMENLYVNSIPFMCGEEYWSYNGIMEIMDNAGVI